MRTNTIPTPSDIATWIAHYFRTHQARTAEVLSGPKRETWFSAETYVALCREISPHPEVPEFPDFSCWGEQEFATVFQLLELERPSAGAPKRKPDIVCYRPLEGIEAVAVVIEIKLVRNDENANACLLELKAQLMNASSFFPDADILGLIFFATAPYLTPRILDSTSERLKQGIERVFPEAYGFTVIPGFGLQSIFHLVPTGFHFPRMKVSLTLAVLQYRRKENALYRTSSPTN